jgi:hypothetical protein
MIFREVSASKRQPPKYRRYPGETEKNNEYSQPEQIIP